MNSLQSGNERTITQLHISELIDLLSRIAEIHGDLPVVLRDADTCWTFRLSADHLALGHTQSEAGDPLRRLEIGGDYSAEFDLPSRLTALQSPFSPR